MISDNASWCRWRTLPAPVRWSAIAVACVAALVAFFALFDWNLARGVIGHAASSRMDREVRIEGSLNVRLFSSTPTFEVRQLRIRNPSWFGPGTMATVGRLKGAIEIAPLFRGRLVFRALEIDQPIVRLSRDVSGRANWWLRPSRDEAAPPAKLPAMRSFRLQNATLRIDDAVRKLSFAGTVAAWEQIQSEVAQSFRLQGHGTLNGERFTLTLTGSPLINIRIDEPYAFAATVNAGATRARLHGSIERPFDLARYATTVDVSGRNLADLYYLTGLPLPLTSAYQLNARVSRDGPEITMSDIAGKVGDSDLRGNASVSVGGKRPFLSADLVSHSLR
ncbi:MAG: AsmA family protein, partial [Steroidobacteraceae bacterium]